MSGSRSEETGQRPRLLFRAQQNPGLERRPPARRRQRVLGLFVFASFALTSFHALAQNWTNIALPASQRAALLLSALTTDEKMALVCAGGGSYVGNIPGVPRLGIPPLTLQDGPAGVRVSDASTTALPAPITLAASWDTALARQYGTIIGEEAHGKGIMVQLGPMMNLARAYQAGRNFEGYGEDPVLAGAMAAAEIQGIQSQGVVATAKHFVCNEQETQRTLVTSDVDERTLQEVYGLPFRSSIRAGVGAVMASYNRVNSRYACELEALNGLLRKQWGFDGWVMSDWGAGFGAVSGMNNGLDMDMYSIRYTTNAIADAIQSGQVPSVVLDDMVRHILTALFQVGVLDHRSSGTLSSPVLSAAHSKFAKDTAAAGIVLLKNTSDLLPLGPSIHSIAVIGSAASTTPISVGGGSASVNLPYHVTPLTGISNRAGSGVSIHYAQGDKASISQAVQIARQCDVAVVCVGQAESEGVDRPGLGLPGNQDELIAAVAAANPRTIVVLNSGSATIMPWAPGVKAILAAWYPGQENGNALAQVLFGDVNPGGKLPVTLPAFSSDVPASTSAQFPGQRGHVRYSEGLEIGYRWFDANGEAPLFPFGFGLSYTTFGYSNLTVSAVSPSGQVQVGFDLTNSGSRPGAEVAQLYLAFPSAAGEPPQLLKGFRKVSLAPHETQHVAIDLNWEDLANWDRDTRGWKITPGQFQVRIGASSRDIRLKGSFSVDAQIPSSELANVALHRPVTVSSDSGGAAGAAVDGDSTTGWVISSHGPQWIEVDLGVVRDLSRVRLQWSRPFASSYRIQFSSDHSTWQTVSTNSNPTGVVEDQLVSGRARYVRLNLAQAVAGECSLDEMAIFPKAQTAYAGTMRSLPGRIQAEDYDTGGQGVGFFSGSASGAGGLYRSDDAGIRRSSDSGGGYDVHFGEDGEWLEYTSQFPDASAIYRLSARVSSASGGGILRVRLDGRVLGTLSIPKTEGSHPWQTVTCPDVPVQGGPGSHALRLEVVAGGFSLDWMNFDRIALCGTNNIANGRPCSASSSESAAYAAANVCDGDPTTRWSSGFSDPQWVSVDLGSVQNLARVRLIWENAFARSYDVQYSTDGLTWTNVYATSNGAGSIDDLAAVGSAHFVRIFCKQRATPYGDSLYELEVYGGVEAAPNFSSTIQ